MAASAFNGVAPDTDDPLDGVGLAGRGREADGCKRVVNRTVLHGCHRSCGQPPGGVLEHDDVAAMHSRYVGDQLVDEHPVPDAAGASVQCRFHRCGRDEECLHEKGLVQQRDHDGADDDAGKLSKERPVVWGRGCRRLISRLTPQRSSGSSRPFPCGGDMGVTLSPVAAYLLNGGRPRDQGSGAQRVMGNAGSG
jgi:hypothetical protein